MSTLVTRRNADALPAIEALVFASITFLALWTMPYYPAWLAMLLAVLVGALAAGAPALAALLLVAVVSLPVLAADFVVGILFLVVGFRATQYLATDRALGFLLITLAIVALPFHAEWAVCAFAGYALGRGRGAVAAALAGITLEFVGIVLGVPVLGSLVTGGMSPGPVTFLAAPPGALTLAWLPQAITAADPARVLGAVSAVANWPLLMAQPALWAIGAGIGGLAGAGTKLRALLASTGAVLAIAGGTALAQRLLGQAVPTPTLVTTGLVSTALAIATVAVAEWVFPPVVLSAPQPQAPAAGVRAEDADVDDLLRVIASAEEELAARHRTESVVLITDMKAFSAMTEEVGSIESAKLVQRHRDVLIPVIERHRGKGKSTGGDGLVAAFASAADALAAAIDMQQTLDAAVKIDPRTREMLVRIGVARGEVVLDKGGRPFLGAAVNLAARVMDLAEGGRIMTVEGVASASGLPGSVLHHHGEYRLKNIAEPIPVVEVLWNEDMAPQQIRES